MKKVVPTLRTIWGLAKSPELRLSDDGLHMIVANQTGKESLKELNTKEIDMVVRALRNLKDMNKKSQKRSKELGNQSTAFQRKKVFKLAEALGWNDKARVDGLCKKMFGVDIIEWLNYEQCSKIIEAMKAMVARNKAAEKKECVNNG